MIRTIKLTWVIKLTQESRRWRGFPGITPAADRFGSALSATHPSSDRKKEIVS